MTEQQIERMLDLLDKIETALGVLADSTETIADNLKAAMETDEFGISTFRMVDVNARHET